MLLQFVSVISTNTLQHSQGQHKPLCSSGRGSQAVVLSPAALLTRPLLLRQCKVIICQMSSTRPELFHWFLFPLALVVYAAISGLLGPMEEAALAVFTALVTAAHVHYGVCVGRQLSEHLNIYIFSLKKRLLPYDNTSRADFPRQPLAQAPGNKPAHQLPQLTKQKYWKVPSGLKESMFHLPNKHTESPTPQTNTSIIQSCLSEYTFPLEDESLTQGKAVSSLQVEVTHQSGQLKLSTFWPLGGNDALITHSRYIMSQQFCELYLKTAAPVMGCKGAGCAENGRFTGRS
ncbi:hypothetical protein EK904_007490 [Melospiza melodia maxima]|nr:hypothetical protein EK904_007490 [Melospiza melodia maxima]